ncbi:MAG: hypothetical protein P9M07_02775 [Candidatus Aceula meridiana]|nr:hypothetical protein [Candidatus Aceula meridiana]
MVSRIIGAIKFLLFLALVPLVAGMTVAFTSQIKSLEGDGYPRYFALGILVYLITHFFVYELEVVYNYGKQLVSDMFRFFEPLVTMAPLVLPIYTIILLVVYYFLKFAHIKHEIGPYFLFLTSFTFLMHLVFTARDLRASDENPVKPNYLFSMAFVYFVNIALIALLLHSTYAGFSFVEFFQKTSQVSAHIYRTSFNQLFVP